MYSASQLDVATVACFLELHEMAPCPMKNAYPDTDLCVSMSDAKSESAEPCSVIWDDLPLRTKQCDLVAFRYDKICLTVLQCA